MKLDRRKFTLGFTTVAFSCFSNSKLAFVKSTDTHDLIADPQGILDLPPGFSYEIISSYGDLMSDGNKVPDSADGMGCFTLNNGRIALVRNHELNPEHFDLNGLSAFQTNRCFDLDDDGNPLSGGTTTIIYDPEKKQRIREFRSLAGTLRNCAGGVTPWGSWLTCEETVVRKSDGFGQDHGWVFEVVANKDGLQDAVPLKQMGRFNHEAAAVDERTGIVYLTEDREDSLFYRFIPNEPGKLIRGGRLQALAFADDTDQQDTRNWGQQTFDVGEKRSARWIDLKDTHSLDDDLRLRGAIEGVAIFARGEGLHAGDGQFYFCCTSGGYKELGQIMRYTPSEHEGTDHEQHSPAILELFYESITLEEFNFRDNLTVAPAGYLVVCEDQYTDKVNNHLRIVTPDRMVIPFARLRLQTELAGACFSPDGSILVVNIYSSSKTLVIRGPWNRYG